MEVWLALGSSQDGVRNATECPRRRFDGLGGSLTPIGGLGGVSDEISRQRRLSSEKTLIACRQGFAHLELRSIGSWLVRGRSHACGQR